MEYKILLNHLSSILKLIAVRNRSYHLLIRVRPIHMSFSFFFVEFENTEHNILKFLL